MFFCGNIQPVATAELKGISKYPTVRGTVNFYDTYGGTILVLQIEGIPDEITKDSSGFLGFHIHEGHCCSGNAQNPFDDAGGHFNPDCCPHPEHAGDMPPLLANCGYALQVFMTNNYSVDEIIGRTVIIHAEPDDFTTQPSGNAGEMIACGEIKRCFCGR